MATPQPTDEQRRLLRDLCALSGLAMDEAVFDSLLNLVLAGVQPAAIMQALRAVKDKKIEDATRRQDLSLASAPWESR